MRFRTIIATAACALVGVVGFGVSQAGAVPVFVTDTHQEGSRLYVDFDYTVPNSAAYVPSFYASIWTNDAHPRRVRALGRHAVRSAERGESYSYSAWFNIAALRAGTYYACIRGVAQLDNGLASTHNSCRRFRLR